MKLVDPARMNELDVSKTGYELDRRQDEWAWRQWRPSSSLLLFVFPIAVVTDTAPTYERPWLYKANISERLNSSVYVILRVKRELRNYRQVALFFRQREMHQSLTSKVFPPVFEETT
jgi:hypothetical protein